jgi:sugar phosphate isomerase/epimerase
MFKENPLEEACEKIRKIGYRGVELDWEILSRQLAKDVHWYVTLGRQLERLELKAASMRVGKFTAEREDQQQLQVHVISQLFHPIQDLGCKRVVLTAGPRTLENFNCLREGLESLAEKAESFGLEIIVSNKLDTRMETLQDFQAMFVAKFPPNTGVCVDVHHCHLAAVNAGDLIREQGARVKLLRLCDMMGNIAVLPGQGEIEIKGLVRALRKAQYDDMIVVDHLPQREAKIEKEVQQAYQYLQEIVV